MATETMENAERWAHELIEAFEREPEPRPHSVVNVTVARWALELQADNERLRAYADALADELHDIRPVAKELLREALRLRGAIEEYLLWEPGKRGHVEAHRRLAAVLAAAPEGAAE